MRAALHFLVVLALNTLVITQSAASERVLAFAPHSEPIPVVKDGISEALSKGISLVRVQILTPVFTEDIIASPGFGIAIYNGTSLPVEFSIADIRATSGSQTAKIYSSEEFSSLLNSEYEREMIMVDSRLYSPSRLLNQTRIALSNSMPSTTPAKSGELAKSADETVGQHRAFLIPRTQVTKQGELMSASTKAVDARVQRAALVKREQKFSERKMLRKTVVQPKHFASGIIRLRASDLETNKPLTVCVTVEGEPHTFSFVVEAKQ